MAFKKKKFLQYQIGEHYCHVLIDAPHASPPKMDAKTGEIAFNVSTSISCNSIIGTISRKKADLNRPPEFSGNPEAVYEYRNSIKEILSSQDLISKDGLLKSPFLHLQIHGMKNRSLDPKHKYELDVEIGTRNTTSCSPLIEEWILSEIKNWGNLINGQKDVVVDINRYFIGDTSKTYHRLGDGKLYQGYGENFHTIQIEFSTWLRKDHQSEVENLLCFLAKDFESSIEGFR